MLFLVCPPPCCGHEPGRDTIIPLPLCSSTVCIHCWSVASVHYAAVSRVGLENFKFKNVFAPPCFGKSLSSHACQESSRWILQKILSEVVQCILSFTLTHQFSAVYPPCSFQKLKKHAFSNKYKRLNFQIQVLLHKHKQVLNLDFVWELCGII